MKTLCRLTYLTILLSAFIAGCDLAKPQGHRQATEAPPVVAEPEPAAPSAVAGTKTEEAGEVKEETKTEEAPEPEKQPETVRVEAKAGVTGKGQYGQGHGEKPMDIITVPVGEYWRTKERIVFEIQIPQAMNLYKASNDDKAPASHEAFMKDIIEANMIKLPDLPQDHKYIYNPETEKLEVEKPR